MTETTDGPVSTRDTIPKGILRGAYQPTLGLDVTLTGDLVRSGDILPGDPTEDCSVLFSPSDDDTYSESARRGEDEEFGEKRRGYGRYRLAANVIRVKILGNDPKAGVGRMTNASVTGFFVRCQSPLPFRTPVRVEWSLLNDMKMSFSGKVVRTTEDGMAIHLSTDDANWRFRASFIDFCRTPTDQPPGVTVRRLSPLEARRYQEDDGVLKQLGQDWKKVEADLNDDEAHQRFIQRCLKMRRLQFALERYRELQTWPVDGFDPTEYLKQIGTILSFYQLQPAQTVEPATIRKYLPVVVVVFLMLMLLVVPYLMGNRVTPPQ